MLGLSPKLPIVDEERLWVDEGFVRLEAMLGRKRLLEAKVILPDAKHFPDAFERNEASVETLIHRICEYMQIDRTRIKLEIFPDEADELRENSRWSIQTNRPTGIYFGHESVMEEDGGVVIALKSSVLKVEGAILGPLKYEKFPDATGLTCDQIKATDVNVNTVFPSYLRQQNCLPSR
jgi:hypothetical protein